MIKRHVISPFGFDVVSSTTPNITIPVSGAAVHGIRIAADSDVDVVDIFAGGAVGGSVADRIRVGAGVPYIGKLPSDCTQIVVTGPAAARIIAPSISPSPQGYDQESAALCPRLILEILYDQGMAEEERLHPTPRARSVRTLTSAVALTDAYFPVMGRSRITVGITVNGTYQIYAFNDANGTTFQDTASPVESGSDTNAGVLFVYEGSPYDYIQINTNAAASVLVMAED